MTAGGAEFMGLDVEGHVRERDLSMIRELQMVFQNPDSTMNPSYTVGQQIERPLRRFKVVEKSEMRDEVTRLLRAVKLDEYYYDRLPRQLSGGEKQRVGIARALAGRPDLVLCDEPVSALDVSVQAAVLNLLLEIQATFGTTMIFIAHDLSVVRFFSDYIAVMYLGKIMELGAADAIYAPPYHPYTESLLAAVPVPDPSVKQEHIRLEGNVPSPLNPPSWMSIPYPLPTALPARRQGSSVRRAGAALAAGCRWAQHLLPCAGRRVGEVGSSRPRRKLIRLERGKFYRCVSPHCYERWTIGSAFALNGGARSSLLQKASDEINHRGERIMLVRDYMTRHPIMVEPDKRVLEVQRLMVENKIRHVPVVGDGKLLLGLVTHERLAIRPERLASLDVWEITRYLSEMTAEKVMISGDDLKSVASDATLEDAADILIHHKVGGLPVIEDGVVVGVLTETDLLVELRNMLGANEPGCRLTVRVPDQPGEFSRLNKAISEKGWGVMAAGSAPSPRVEGHWDIVMKVRNCTFDQLKELVDGLPEQQIVDLRETSTAHR